MYLEKGIVQFHPKFYPFGKILPLINLFSILYTICEMKYTKTPFFLASLIVDVYMQDNVYDVLIYFRTLTMLMKQFSQAEIMRYWGLHLQSVLYFCFQKCFLSLVVHDNHLDNILFEILSFSENVTWGTLHTFLNTITNTFKETIKSE